MALRLKCHNLTLEFDRPLIMGIVNVTPDSFSDGGQHTTLPAALAHARRLIDEGADILDIGGESTRPGSQGVSLDEELRRVMPLVEALADCGVPISVDTLKPEVMRRAAAAGAHIINDVYGLRAPGALEAVAATDAAVCLMHMQGEPRTMQDNPTYADVTREVSDFLIERAAAAEAAGIARDRILLDPGFGFGKNLDHNITLFRQLPHLAATGLPILVGVSRKRMLGDITGRPVSERVHASVAAAVIAAQNGAHILRVHDVAATVDALQVWQALAAKES